MATIVNEIDLLLQSEARYIDAPSNSPYPLTLVIVENTNGSRDITLTWSYAQGVNKADTLGLFWESGATLGATATPTIASKYVELQVSTTSYTFLGVDPTKAYKVSIAVGLYTEEGLKVGTLIRSGTVTWDVTPGISNNTNTINGVLASTISAATANFNTRNDRLATAITAPASLALVKTEKSIGSVDLTVSWSWGGAENDIDGFAIYVCADNTDAAHTLGASTDTVYLVPPATRYFTGFNIAADLFYTVGVRAYRVVDKDIDASSFIVSSITQLAPYQPNSAPNITALINGVPANTITASLANYNTLNDMNGAAIAAPNSPIVDYVNNTNGSCDITLTWNWTGNNADIDGFGIYVYIDASSASHVANGTTDTVFWVKPDGRSRTWLGVDATKYYHVSICAYRAVATSVDASGFISSSFTQVVAFRPNSTPSITALINGVPASSITTGLANFNSLNDMNGATISAPTGLTITKVDNTNGSSDVTLSWTWSGNNFDIDGFAIYVYAAATNAAHSVNQYGDDTVYITKSDARSRTWLGVDSTKFYTLNLTAYRSVNTVVSATGYINSSFVSYGPYRPNAAPSVTALINGVAASTITSATTNFNASNDMNGTAIAAPTSVNVTSSANPNGSYDVTLTWNWGGANSDIDGFGIYVYAGATGAAHSVNLTTDTVYVTKSDARTFTWYGVDSTKYYTVNVVAYRAVNTAVSGTGFILSSFVPFGPYQPNANPNLTTLINGIAASTITSSVANYNTSNDNNSSAIAACTGLSLTTVNNTNGSVDVTLNWTWGGTNADIDGFGIYVYSAATNAAHTITTTDVVYWSRPETRAKTWYGIDATKFYSVGIVAYRAVNHTINASGFITSSIVQLSPYQPNSAPNITTAINSVAASTLTTQASAGNTAATDTATFRTAGVPTNQPVVVSTTSSAISTGGTVDITITWTYTQGALPADNFIIYSAQGTTAPTTSSPVSAIVSGNDRSYTFVGVPADKNYRAGIVASRKYSGGIQSGTIVTGFSYTAQTVSLSVAAGNIQGQINASTQLLNASLTAAKTALAAIDASTGNLSANSVTTSNIVAGAVTALKIAVGQLDAISANLGTVTAGTLDTTGYVRARGAISVDGNNAAIVANDSITQVFGVYGKGSLCGGRFSSNGATYASGVNGTSTIGYGVYGYTNTGRGVLGYADAAGGTGVHALATNGAKALHVEGTSSYTQVADFYDGIRFSSNNTLKFNWASDWTVAPKTTLAGKTHQAWITFYVDSTLFKIPLFQD